MVGVAVIGRHCVAIAVHSVDYLWMCQKGGRKWDLADIRAVTVGVNVQLLTIARSMGRQWTSGDDEECQRCMAGGETLVLYPCSCSFCDGDLSYL
jgi:hypothetical protein